MRLSSTTALLMLVGCGRFTPGELCTPTVGTNDPNSVVLINDNNFRYTAQIDIEAQPLAQGEIDYKSDH